MQPFTTPGAGWPEDPRGPLLALFPGRRKGWVLGKLETLEVSTVSWVDRLV